MRAGNQRRFIILFICSSWGLGWMQPASEAGKSFGGEQFMDTKCGFPQVLQANSPGNEELLKRLLRIQQERIAVDTFYISPAGRFKIFYERQGVHAIPDYDRNQDGFPDYLQFVANAFDRAWQIEIDSLGFRPPPDSLGNDRQIYPVYCRKLGFYGQTWLEYEIPSRPGANYVTYIEINTDFTHIVHYPGVTDPAVRDSMAIAVTAAHEFNHALQCGYRLWPQNNSFYDLWFIESSATFMEELVAPQVNDYLQYLEDYFRKTHFPLDLSTGGFSDYGKVVLPLMLGKLYGADITEKIWSQILTQRALPALQSVLRALGADLSGEMHRLALWCYFTGAQAGDGEFFPDAEWFPTVGTLTGATIENSQRVLVNDFLPHLSFQWYNSPALADLELKMLSRPAENVPVGSLLATYVDPQEGTYLQTFTPSAVKLPFPVGISGLSFAISNGFAQGDQNFEYEVIAKPVSDSGVTTIQVYPQPFRYSTQQPFLQFSNLPPSAKILIYDSNGKHLVSLETGGEIQHFMWDLKTKHGEFIGSGVYIYHVQSESVLWQGKFLVIK